MSARDAADAAARTLIARYQEARLDVPRRECILAALKACGERDSVSKRQLDALPTWQLLLYVLGAGLLGHQFTVGDIAEMTKLDLGNIRLALAMRAASNADR